MSTLGLQVKYIHVRYVHQPNIHQQWWYEESGMQFSQKSDIWWKNLSSFCLFLDLKKCELDSYM